MMVLQINSILMIYCSD